MSFMPPSAAFSAAFSGFEICLSAVQYALLKLVINQLVEKLYYSFLRWTMPPRYTLTITANYIGSPGDEDEGIDVG